MVVWLPSGEECKLLTLAKEKAKIVTKREATPQTQFPIMRFTTLRIAQAKRDATRRLRRTLENTPKEWIQYYRASIRDNFMIGCHGKRPVC